MTTTLLDTYPQSRSDRDRWILEKRPQRNSLDPQRPYAFFLEEERSDSGEIVPIATILLTNRECPWRCLMCDLWKNTLSQTVPKGAIPAQIDYALKKLPTARQIKLYNSGSFFDPRAIPVQDYPQIASRIQQFDRVIVESHPALIGDICLKFRGLISGQLEVAMGLETVHPQILQKLNKGMTVKQFALAAAMLRNHDIALRVFILVKPPFMQEAEAVEWAKKSLDFAMECGATAATLIPTRAGNGALDELVVSGDFAPPRMATLEAVAEYGLSLHRGRVFLDLWDMDKTGACGLCRQSRVDRLKTMNLQQTLLPPMSCGCDAHP
jgi:radical SAM enzyme (TIGR01210 family)